MTEQLNESPLLEKDNACNKIGAIVIKTKEVSIMGKKTKLFTVLIKTKTVPLQIESGTEIFHISFNY